jgi:hypothetical protein
MLKTFTVGAFLFLTSAAFAQVGHVRLDTPDASACDATPDTWFSEERSIHLQLLAGDSASSGLGPNPDFDYVPFNVRAGIVLLPDHRDWLLGTGDVTGLLDLVVARPRVHGSIVVGPSLLLRKDLRPNDACLIPYTQLGVGIVYTDADNDQSQDVIGRSWECLLQAGAGCHFRLSDRWKFDVEGHYQHISNAQLASRNLGSNNIGVSLGVTRLFGATP